MAVYDLPPARVNARVGRYEVDFLRPEERLVVEADGFAHHAHRRAFEHDRHRHNELTVAGLTVLHVTHRQLVERPGHVAATVRATLAARASGLPYTRARTSPA